MRLSRFAWTGWAVLPALALAYHFGPGQRHYDEAKAARTLVEAARLEAQADAAQDRAYDAHLAALSARIAARENPAEAFLARAAQEGTAAESEAYERAAEAWARVAEAYGSALDTLAESRPEIRDSVRLARARALVRSGNLDSGVSELESIMDTAQTDPDLVMEAREEFATAHYFGARALRVQGAPATEWRAVATVARENFRYIAEHAALAEHDQNNVVDMQRNSELALNLEQSALGEILAKPRPRGAPGDGVCKAGSLPGRSPGKGRGKRGAEPSNGAGNLGEIGDGW